MDAISLKPTALNFQSGIKPEVYLEIYSGLHVTKLLDLREQLRNVDPTPLSERSVTKVENSDSSLTLVRRETLPVLIKRGLLDEIATEVDLLEKVNAAMSDVPTPSQKVIKETLQLVLRDQQCSAESLKELYSRPEGFNQFLLLRAIICQFPKEEIHALLDNFTEGASDRDESAKHFFSLLVNAAILHDMPEIIILRLLRITPSITYVTNSLLIRLSKVYSDAIISAYLGKISPGITDYRVSFPSISSLKDLNILILDKVLDMATTLSWSLFADLSINYCFPDKRLSSMIDKLLPWKDQNTSKPRMTEQIFKRNHSTPVLLKLIALKPHFHPLYCVEAAVTAGYPVEVISALVDLNPGLNQLDAYYAAKNLNRSDEVIQVLWTHSSSCTIL